MSYRRNRGSADLPNQHPVPGQNPPLDTPFLPTRQPDIIQQQPGMGSPTERPTPFVISTFDTRPINAQDFFRSGLSVMSVPPDAAVETAQFNYVPPVGYLAVIRRIEVAMIGPSPTPEPGAEIIMDLLENGAPIFQNDNQPVYYALSPLRFDTHIAILGGNTFSVRFRSTGVATDGGTFVFQVTGNLLLSGGYAPSDEIGTKVSIPVKRAEVGS